MRRIRFFDTTLRDGEQSPGVNLNADEKLEIARQLGQQEVPALVINTAPGDRQQNSMPGIAAALGTGCQHIYHLQAGQILQLIETTRPASK